MFCMQCGTQLPNTAQFCYSCGAKISAIEPASVEQQPEKSKDKNFVEQESSDEETEIFAFSISVQQAIRQVIEANKDNKKISREQYFGAWERAFQMFPTTEEFQRSESPLPPVSSKEDVVYRLKMLAREYPFLMGVYKKYDAQLDRPVICINCGSEFAPSALFCPDCGTEITSPEEE